MASGRVPGRSFHYRRVRDEMVAEPGVCWWCNCPLAAGKGDADNVDGLAGLAVVRACIHCNRDRQPRGTGRRSRRRRDHQPGQQPGSASFFK